MRQRGGIALLVVVAGLAVAPAHADVVFPARLDVVEVARGQYDIAFTLPIMEGRVLRAEPVMPPICRDLTERERTGGSAGVTTTWSVICDPPSLAGEAILVEGLLGTQIELAFSLRTLDGRIFSEILKPSRPGFLVPHPPSAPALAAEAGSAGVTWVLRQLALWLLALVVSLAGVRRHELARGIATFAVSVVAAQWLVSRGWLNVAAPVAEAFALATAAIPAVRLAGAGERWRGWIDPLWPVMLFVGALAGGAGTVAVSTEGLSRGEQLLALGLFGAGAALGLAWLLVVGMELRLVLARGANSRWLECGVRALGYALGAVAAGMLLARVIALVLLAQSFPPRALTLVLAAAALAPLLTAAGGNGRWAVPAFVGFAGVGLSLGLAQYAMPLDALLVPAVLLAVGLALVLGRTVPRPWAMATLVGAVVVCSWSSTTALVDNVSRSTGAAAATVAAAAAVFFAGLATWRKVGPAVVTVAARVAGLAVALMVGGWRLTSYWSWFEREVTTAAALGLLRIPVAALVFTMFAALLWPRRRRVLVELGVAGRAPVWHWLMLAAAFLVLPYGTLTVRNPFHEPQAPHGDDARRVASAVLFDTYQAFNLTKEEEVFDRLADSVTGDLVEDLYLDSRRRLNAGTREGTEVTVREVSVLEIGEPKEREAGSGSFSYDCRWVVTSRVRHLQHIHHRQNIYGGVLTLTVEDDRWKIAHVELASEDRILMSRRPI